MNSASLCSLAGRYDNPIPTRFLAPIDFLKIPAQESMEFCLPELWFYADRWQDNKCFFFSQKKIDKRGRKLIDFDAERHAVQQMQNNPNRNEVSQRNQERTK